MLEPVKWSTLNPNQRDALIAQYVFKRKIVAWKEGRDLLMEREGAVGHEAIPDYSTDMNAAIAVIRHFTVPFEIRKGNDFTCRIGAVFADKEPSYGISKDPADAVCLAALRACGIEVNTGNYEQTSN